MRKRLAVVGASIGALAVGGLLLVPPAAHATTKAATSASSSGCIVIPLIVPGWHITICL